MQLLVLLARTGVGQAVRSATVLPAVVVEAANTLASTVSAEIKQRATLTEWCKIIFKSLKMEIFKSLRETRQTDLALKSPKLKKWWTLRRPYASPATWRGERGGDQQGQKEPAEGRPLSITVKAGNATGRKEDRSGSMIWALLPDKPWIWVELKLPKKIKQMVSEGSQGWSERLFSNQIRRLTPLMRPLWILV